MSSSVIVDELEALRAAFPRAPLVVFVPRTQLGQALETALALRRGSWEGVRFLLPREYAKDVARPDIVRSGRIEAGVEGHLFRTARILQDRPDPESVETLPGWHLLARTVGEALDTLRRNDVDVESVRNRARALAASETLSVVADCYAEYVREIDEQRLYDDATLFEWATVRVRRGTAPGVGQTVYATVRSTDLSEHAAQFLTALRAASRDVVMLGPERPLEAPPATAAARFPEFPTVGELEPGSYGADGRRSDPERGTEHFVRAVGARKEVRSVFRDLLDEQIPFDEVTVAYTTSRPYASLLADETERLGVPSTVGTGLPADHTRTGRALRGLFDWVRDDFDPEPLIRMLRSGLLRTDRWLRNRDEEDPLTLRPHEAATLLADRSYESGRDGLLKGLRSAVEAADAHSETENAGSAEAEHQRQRELLLAYVQDLAGIIPPSTEVETLADNACHFLEVFGPTDRPSTPEAERSPDEAARALLYDRLESLGTLDVGCEARGYRLAALFGRWLDGQYVQAETPRPGHVHVLPLESAGYSDRRHLYVVGLDSTTFSGPTVESGMLQETDRRALVASFESGDAGQSERPPTAADEALWQAEGALRRHQGRIVYCTRIFDVEAGEERDPSSLFLQRERAAVPTGDEDATSAEDGSDSHSARSVAARVEGLVPDAGALPLSDGELWLQAYRTAREEVRSTGVDDRGPDTETARERLEHVYPWIVAGEQAQAARQSDVYTVHDGLLPAGAYPELRLVDNSESPLSASRLELLAEAPYLYFIKYVLDVDPLEEPALDDEPWFNHLRKGSLLHDIYEQVIRNLDGAVPTPDAISMVEDVVEAVLEDEASEFAPPSRVVKASAQRVLRENALLFLRAETERAPAYRPERLEWAFGADSNEPDPEAQPGPAQIPVADGVMHLRGRIDRVDRHRQSEALSVWDYKTGSSSSYDESDPLNDGKTLQWALYAYAVEDLTGENVAASGYFFANVKEMGRRIAASPAQYRPDVEAILERLNALAESGSFPMTPRLTKVDAWAWGGYDWIVDDLRARRDQLRSKEYPEDRPVPHSF